MKHLLSISLLWLLTVGATQAESDVTQARQQIFTNIEEQSENLEDLVDDEMWKEAAPLAEELANKVAKLIALFPESSKGEGRSRDGVWEEWPQFSIRLQNFGNDFRTVADAINEGDYEYAENALDDATSACRSCHMSYRSLW